MTELNENQLELNVEGTYFHDAAIIPTVMYQVYGIEKPWFWDDEGQNYNPINPNGSSIKIQVVTGTERTYYEVGELSLGDEVTGLETAPKGGINVTEDDYPEDLTDYKVGDVFYKEVKGEPGAASTYKSKTVEAELTKVEGPSTVTSNKGLITDDTAAPEGSVEGDVYYTETEVLEPFKSPQDGLDPYEFNKYLGEAKTIYVTIEPSETLAEQYPLAIVTVNGKEHDLAYLNNPIKLYMDKEYRISIQWSWGTIVETFRVLPDFKRYK